MPTVRQPSHSTNVLSGKNSGESEFISDPREETETLAELRSTHADAAAVADFVFFIEDVHDIATEAHRIAIVEMKNVLVADVDGIVGLHLAGVGEAAAQAGGVEHVDI